MSVRRGSKKAATAEAAGSEQGGERLAGVRPLATGDEERPSREDRGYGETIFSRPAVPLPRWLRGGKRKSQ